MASPVLSFSDVRKSYASVHAIKGVDLEIERGERVAVLGCNGAGKTTLISLATGMRLADAGELTVLGNSPRSFANKSQVRILPQTLDFPATLTVREILELSATHFSEQVDHERLALLDLEKLMNRKTSALSGGEKRKLGIACTLMGHPEILVLDEPTANIDIIGRSQIYEILNSYLSSERTLIFSSHQIQEIERLAQRIVVLREGRIVADGSSLDVKKQFGLKKLRFQSDKPDLIFEDAHKITKEADRTVVFGEDSDSLVRQLIHQDTQAKNIEIIEPDLEEIFLHLWQEEPQ